MHTLIVLSFTGSEHRSWLLYYSLPVLKDILPLPYLKNYNLLVASLYILSSDHITPGDLQNCEEWLKEFYKRFEELYGEHITCSDSPLTTIINYVCIIHLERMSSIREMSRFQG